MQMQEGDEEENTIMKNIDSDEISITVDLDNNLSRSSSQQLSAVKRSASHGLSRHSFTLSYPEAEIGDADKKKDDELSSGNRKKIPIRRLAELNKPELSYVLLGSLAAIIHGLIMPLFELLLSAAIRSFFNPPHKLQNESRFLGLMCVGLGVVTLLVIPFQNYFFGVAGGKLIEKIRSLIFKKVVHQEISWFDDPANSSSAVGARLSTDASIVRTLVGDTLALIVQNMATAIGGLVIAFTAKWILAIIILLVLPLIGLQGFFLTKLNGGYNADAKVTYGEASQIANGAVGSIRTVASFSAEEKVMDMYQKKCVGPMKKGVKIGILSGASLGFGCFTLYCAVGFCFFIGYVLIEHNLATFGQVLRYATRPDVQIFKDLCLVIPSGKVELVV